MLRKWEHDIAILHIHGSKKGLDICRDAGVFIGRVLEVKEITFERCEQNSAVVAAACGKGLQVYLERSENLALNLPCLYDVVCAFQLFEHVSRHSESLKVASKLLCLGGKFLLRPLNARSFLRYQFNHLHLSPLHLTRWNDKLLTRLQRWFPLRHVRIAYEPLAHYHTEGYVEAYMRMLPQSGLSMVNTPGMCSLITHFIQLSGMRELLRGQAIYGCFCVFEET